MSKSEYTVLRLEKGCEAGRQGVGCACLGICHELVDVVSLEDAARLVGERNEARRQFKELLEGRAL